MQTQILRNIASQVRLHQHNDHSGIHTIRQHLPAKLHHPRRTYVSASNMHNALFIPEIKLPHTPQWQFNIQSPIICRHQFINNLVWEFISGLLSLPHVYVRFIPSNNLLTTSKWYLWNSRVLCFVHSHTNTTKTPWNNMSKYYACIYILFFSFFF